jgi:hypothetical protein
MPYSSGGYTPIKPGQPLTAKEINRNIAQGPMRGAQYTGNADTRRFHNGNAVDFPEGGGISPWSAYMRPAIVTDSSEDDLLEVQFYSEGAGAATGSAFTVAKAYSMRLSEFPSAPTYTNGDIVTIARVPTKVGSTIYDWVDMAVGKGSGGASVLSADTKANLTTLMTTDGLLGYTTGGTKRFYVKINSTMVCISHLEY